MAAAALQAAQWSSSSTAPAASFMNAAAAHLPQPPTGGVGGSVVPRSKSIWPPNFETDGGLYTFQSQSGYFFEPNSDYYYCPKSKLYYNATDGIYYKYNAASQDPHFQRFDPPLPSTSAALTTTTNSTSTASNENAPTEGVVRKQVVVSMSLAKAKPKPMNMLASVITSVVTTPAAESAAVTAAMTSSNQDSAAAATTAATVMSDMTIHAKKIQNNLAKWTAVSDTMSGSSVAPTVTTAITQPVPSINNASVPTPAAVVATHACLLCRRGFNSAEQLLRHEKESKLHAENLLKAASSVPVSGCSSTANVVPSDVTWSNTTNQSQQSQQQYRDRASERRAVQGDSIPVMSSRPRGNSISEDNRSSSRNNKAPQQQISGGSSSSSSIPAPVFMDTENPGNQLLRKMGWSEGKGLGKEGVCICVWARVCVYMCCWLVS